MLSRRQRGNHAQEALEFVTFGQHLQSCGAPREDGGEIGQANRRALGDIAQYVFAEAAGRVVRTGAQGLPTSWRNHLRWCFQAQPPLTEPRVMARSVPLTQMAA